MTNKFTMITIYMVAFTGFSGFSWLSVVTPYYFSSLGIEVSNIGLMMAIFAYVNAAGMFPASMLSERWGRRNFLISGLIIATIAPILYPLTSDIHVLYLVCILHALGSTLFVPAVLAIVTELSEPGEFGKSIGLYSASAQLGLMSGPVAGGFILQHFGFFAAYASCGFMPLLSLIFVLIKMRNIPVRITVKQTQGTSSWGWLTNNGIIISLLCLIMIAIGVSSVNTFIPLYVRGFGITEGTAGLIITACYASSAALRIPAGTLSDKFGNVRLILGGTILCGLAIAFLAIFTNVFLIIVATLIFGVGIGLSMPSSLAWLPKIAPAEKIGIATGLGATAYQVGLAIGATTLGSVVQAFGYPFMYMATAIAIGLIVIVIFFMSRKRPAP
jgi:MFS transporter, DHA1 family, multidrug resistance protein